MLKILHLTKQPDRCHRQAIGTDKKCHHQQNNTVLRGVSNQDCHAQQSNHHADKPQRQRGDIDDPHTNPDGHSKQQNYRSHLDLQQ